MTPPEGTPDEHATPGSRPVPPPPPAPRSEPSAPPVTLPATPDGPPEPVVVPDLAPESIRRDLDWNSPDYQGVRRRSRRKKPKKHWYRPRNTLGFPALALVLVLLAALIYVNAQMSSIRRAPLMPELGGRASAGTNVLLVTSASAEHSLASDPRTMVIQLVHLAADGANASVINLPTDTYLPDPTRPAKDHGSVRLVDAYRAAGIPRLVKVIDHALDLDIDHAAQIGVAGYARVTDRLGGVDMPTTKGARHFTGAQAQRYTSDTSTTSIESGRLNQVWLKAMLTETMTPSVLLNPFSMIGLLKDTKPNLVIDDQFTNGALRDLLWKARHLRASTIRFITVPHRGYATRTEEHKDKHGKVEHTRIKVLLPDTAGLRQLGAAIRTDNDAGIAVFGS